MRKITNTEIKASITYQLPNYLTSRAEMERFYNHDIQEMDDLALWREKLKLELVIGLADIEGEMILTPGGDHLAATKWLEVRYKAVVSENMRRKENSC
ncbi:MAG: hypothetical protein WBJ42_06965 [Thermovirgaceae bacterium]|nr:hypothetical protein [Synergistales bacterium]HPC76106.1 hypothetical protein [Synergistales bacterium]HRS48783.1 hypothetical protein [Thermovirgaceae bacterium]HRU90987.1 hypothetical protein [Thermovirgaceae bacterium]